MIVSSADIQRIFTTGGKAATLYRKYIHLEVPHTPLPSTSAAHASMRLEDLVKEYDIVRRACEED